ncbi:hypothetical protein [Burkholderia pseudomallei]|uniref:hypothetical protein n=1 Tax=Burkholderia pseudomallei TaxID=28450 RepID=UPI0005382211|nr:hypothetical protein Y030_1024 [Burkholderia pseudomallei MSHR332]
MHSKCIFKGRRRPGNYLIQVNSVRGGRARLSQAAWGANGSRVMREPFAFRVGKRRRVRRVRA